jgi:hypothetical protein
VYLNLYRITGTCTQSPRLNASIEIYWIDLDDGSFLGKGAIFQKVAIFMLAALRN